MPKEHYYLLLPKARSLAFTVQTPFAFLVPSIASIAELRSVTTIPNLPFAEASTVDDLPRRASDFPPDSTATLFIQFDFKGSGFKVTIQFESDDARA